MYDKRVATQHHVLPWTLRIYIQLAVQSHTRTWWLAGDAHFRVAVAALNALAEAMRCGPRVLEPHADRLLPPLFLRVIDAKEVIRTAASGVLAGIAAYLMHFHTLLQTRS